jgi:hypothetical protein
MPSKMQNPIFSPGNGTAYFLGVALPRARGYNPLTKGNKCSIIEEENK